MSLKSRSSSEWVLIIVVVAGAMLLSIGLYRGRIHVSQEGRLIHELSALRSAIMLHRTLEQKFPPDLESLMQGRYQFVPGELQAYVNISLPQKGEHYLDPFGGTYHYNAEIGWISTETGGYEQW